MDVFCFDFDGVVCDSAPETAVTAWKGCRELWPEIGAELPLALQERFCRLRPVLHTGFEAVPLMRLIEQGRHSDEELLERFPQLLDELIERERLTSGRLKELFGGIRDVLIGADQALWLEWNRFYPGIGEALTAAIAGHPVFIVTTKQERFVSLLLDHHRIDLPPERIFGLERNRTKPEILAELMARPEWNGATFHLIEDRLDTLMHVIADPALEDVRLYLADWGYNTPRQREEAAALPRIEVVSVEAFRRLHGL